MYVASWFTLTRKSANPDASNTPENAPLPTTPGPVTLPETDAPGAPRTVAQTSFGGSLTSTQYIGTGVGGGYKLELEAQ